MRVFFAYAEDSSNADSSVTGARTDNSIIRDEGLLLNQAMEILEAGYEDCSETRCGVLDVNQMQFHAEHNYSKSLSPSLNRHLLYICALEVDRVVASFPRIPHGNTRGPPVVSRRATCPSQRILLSPVAPTKCL